MTSTGENKSIRATTFVFLFAALIGIDQWVKYSDGNIFHNFNFAFSLPLPAWLMYIIYAAVLAGLAYYCVRNFRGFNFYSRLAWALLFAGAISNIAERIVLGYVRDFIYISFYNRTGVYNLADGYIILGMLILFIQSCFLSRRNTVNNKEL